MRFFIVLGLLSVLKVHVQAHNTLDTHTASQDDKFKELLISFEFSAIAKQILTRIFADNKLSLPELLKYPDPFETFYVENIKMNSYYPSCPVCEKTFKSREYLHMHAIRKHLPVVLDSSKRYTIFSDACEFMPCSTQEVVQEEYKPLNNLRCMRFIAEHFTIENKRQILKVCKAIISNTEIESSRESVIYQIFEWLLLIIFAMLTLIFIAFIIDSRFARDTPVFMHID